MSRVDECLRVKVFCLLAASADSATAGGNGGGKQGKAGPKAAKAKAVGKADGKNKSASKAQDGAAADAAGDGNSPPKLEKGERHLVGETVVRIRDAFDARRTTGFRWHSLSDVSKGGAGISCYAGQLGLHIETVDFSAAGMPKPPPEVAHVECQTDLAQERAARKAVEKAAQLALPHRKSRFAEKMVLEAPVEVAKPSLGLNRPYSDWEGRHDLTTPRGLLPAPLLRRPVQPKEKQEKEKRAQQRVSKNFRTIASRCDHLYDFDGAGASAAKATQGEEGRQGPSEEEAHWQKMQKMKDILLGVSGPLEEK